MGKLYQKHSYLDLPHSLYARLEKSEPTHYTIRYLNDAVVEDFNILLQEEDLSILNGNHDDIFAMAYAGHQYGHFTMLGDGRAMMLGELHHQQQRFDVHVKGSGPTPFSRRGDGYATLLSSLKEYLMSEALHQLGVPTTRPLAVLDTNQTVYRETPQDGSMLIRIGQSHIRIGTVEYARALQQPAILQSLLDYTINRLYPEIKNANKPYLTLFDAVVNRQAQLIATWQSLGFVHGVLNTDNVLLSGETIDYGPCAFLDEFDPSLTFSSIDRNGRYSYQKQPYITSWNLSKLAAAMVMLIDPNETTAIDLLNRSLAEFEVLYTQYYYEQMAQKLGLEPMQESDKQLIDELLELMQRSKADYTNTFYQLTIKDYESLPFSMVEWSLLYDKWMKRQPNHDLMKQVNPVVIPRNHLVLQAIEQAAFDDNDELFNTLIDVYKDPYNYERDVNPMFQEPNPNKERFVTYCGT